jgi:hypothetical protein
VEGYKWEDTALTAKEIGIKAMVNLHLFYSIQI